MACRVNHDSGFEQAMELLSEQGFEGLAQAVALLINTAMRVERHRH